MQATTTQQQQSLGERENALEDNIKALQNQLLSLESEKKELAQVAESEKKHSQEVIQGLQQELTQIKDALTKEKKELQSNAEAEITNLQRQFEEQKAHYEVRLSLSVHANITSSQSLVKDLKVKAEELEKNQSSSTQSLTEQISALQLQKDAIQSQLEEVR